MYLGCQQWFCNAQPQARSVGLLNTPTMWQRQAQISITPQYTQDSETSTSTPKGNYNQQPLQIYTSRGRDETTWRGVAFQLWTSLANPDTAATTVYFPAMVKFTVEFSGRRNIMGTLPTAEGHLLGYDFVGNNDDTRDRDSRAKQDGECRLIDRRKCSTPMSNLHRHWLIKMSRQVRKSQFPVSIQNQCWLAVVTCSGGDTLKEAIEKYLNYIKGKGSPLVQRGVPLPQMIGPNNPNKRTKNEIILSRILDKERCSTICLDFPQLLPQIYKLARFRPQRTHRTDLVYYYGPPGTGKTTAISRVLNTIRKLYPEVDYYAKMGGISKFYDGYNNQPITWIDDPVSSSCFRTGDEEPVQHLKTVISYGETLIEVKHGSMVFDSSLIVISTNIDPESMAKACGIDNECAMYRKFTDTAGAHEIPESATAHNKLIEHLTKVIARNMHHVHNIEIDVARVIKSIPGVNVLTYEDLDFHTCDCKKYFN